METITKENTGDIFKKYRCEFCGQEYNDALDRAICEIQCYQFRQGEIARNKPHCLERSKERSARAETICKVYLHLCNLCENYEKEYGIRYTYDIGYFPLSEIDEYSFLKL